MKTILTDMDGVFANWVRAACKAHGREDLVKKADDGEYPHAWDMDGELGSDADVWWPIDIAGEDFWYEIEPYKWMNKYLEILENTGIPWYIVTHARNTPESYSGKLKWIHEYLGVDFKNIVMTKHKHLLANPETLLIDDNTDNCAKFIEHGGHAYLFPQPWNKNDGMSRYVGVRLAIEEVFGKEVFNVRV